MSVVRRAMMKAALRSLAVCVGLCLMGPAVASPVAFAEGGHRVVGSAPHRVGPVGRGRWRSGHARGRHRGHTVSQVPVRAVGVGEVSSSLGGVGDSPLESPLVVSGVQRLVGGQGVVDAEVVSRVSPEGVLGMEASRTAYEGLDVEQAAKLAGEVFPGVIDELGGGPPRLLTGESSLGFPTDNAEQISLGGEGKDRHALIESLTPIAVETSPGQRAPVDLGLGEVGGGFQPDRPIVGVGIPKRLQEGVSLAGTGVSLTPLSSSGSAVGGSEGQIEGASVFYGGVGQGSDVDVSIKPTTFGFESTDFLRSELSPVSLSFRVGMPEGASLVQAGDGSGVVHVMDEGTAIATVIAPSALDATGASVPVAMKVSGNVLILSVEDRSGGFTYPIAVDPKVFDEQLTGASLPTHWKFAKGEGSSHFSSSGWKESHGVSLESSGYYLSGETGFLNYQAEGEARLIRAELYVSGTNHGKMETALQLTNGGNPTDSKLVSPAEQSFAGTYTVCPFSEAGECPIIFTREKEVASANFVRLLDSATGEGSSENKATVSTADVSVWQENGPKVKFNTASKTIGGSENVLYEKPERGSGWLSKYNGAFEVEGEDPGVGVSYLGVVLGSWVSRLEYYNKGDCEGVWCNPKAHEAYTYPEGSGVPDGEDTLRLAGEDMVKEFAPEATITVKVDSTPPYGLSLTGLPAGGQINDEIYHLKVQATDGKAPTPSSGVKSLKLGLDGYELLGGKSGSCTPGPCTTTGEWMLNGEDFGAGKHKLELTATDYAGNVEKTEYNITVRHAAPLSVGPGSVDPITGALRLGASDVTIGTGQGSLGVSRSYNSRELTAGAEGPLGPQWSFSVSGSEGIEQEKTGSVVLINAGGGKTSFESNGKGGFISPKGDENLMLEAEKEGETIKAYLLKNPAEGTTVKYVQQGGAGPWVVVSTEGALSKTNGEKETFEWERLEGVTRPKRAIATPPQGVTCPPTELKPGCRALEFEYATETTAEGEKESQWKKYKGRLEKVVFRAYNSATKAMESKPVAEYVYDKQGRLRAEWDPRISPALKTIYGYDEEGHVTALTAPGQQPWVFTYGTIAGDSGTGRVLKVTQAHPNASESESEIKEKLNEEREAPTNTKAPTMSGTAIPGAKLEVSNGSWSNRPVMYGYQWERCNPAGAECASILGATNESYTPNSLSDDGHTLIAEVTATTSGGSVVAASAATSVIGGSQTTGEYLLPSGDRPEQVVEAPGGNVWFTDWGTSKIGEMAPSGTVTEYSLPEGSDPYGIVLGPDGNLWFTETGTDKIGKMTTSGTERKEYSLPAGSGPYGITVGPDENLWFTDYRSSMIGKITTAGTGIKEYALPSGSGTAGITAGPSNYLWFTNPYTNKIGKITTGGTEIKEYEVGSEGRPDGIVEGPEGDVWFVDTGSSKIGKITPSGTELKEYALPANSHPRDIAKNGATGELWFTSTGADKLGKINTSTSEVTEYVLPAGSNPFGIAPGSEGNFWYVDYGTGKIGEIPSSMTQSSGRLSAEYLLPSGDRPEQVVEAPGGNVWFTDWGTSKIGEMTPSGTVTEYSLPEGSDPYGIVLGPDGNLWFTETGTNKIGKMTTSGAERKEYSLPAGSGPYGITVGPDKNLWFTDYKSSMIGKITTAGTELKEYGLPSGSGTAGITAGPGNYLWFTNPYTNKIGKLSTGGTEIKEYEVGSEGRPDGIAEGPEGNIWFVDAGSSKIGKITASGTELKEYALPTGSHPREIAKNGDELWFTSTGANKLGKINTSTSEVTEYSLPAGSNPFGIAPGANGNFWFADYSNYGIGKIGKVILKPEDEYGPPQPGWTLEYGVPLSGPGLPTMTKAEVEKWGQTDDPAEPLPGEPLATAVFPPDEPMGWPAKDYKRASITYYDESGRTVNHVSPSGGISTSEYNEDNEVTRSLSADNRATALESSKSQEVSELLDTKSKYNIEGTELESTLGPQHMVKLASGAEKEARNHIRYYYDEGSPEGETYDLPTKTIDGAEYEGGGEVDRRTTTTAYSGQDNLGWLLRKPTSVTTDPTNGLKGVFEFAFGDEGEESHQVHEPDGVAVAPNGDVYVADTKDNRVEEYSATDSYIASFGKEGTGNGEFKAPEGIAVNGNGDVYVADTGNNRVQEFEESGKYLAQFGNSGSTEERVTKPSGVAVAPNGDVWVVNGSKTEELGSYRVREYTGVGKYVRRFGKEFEKAFDTCGDLAAEWVKTPHGIAVAANGDVFLTDTGDDCVGVFNEEGKYVRKFGSEGSGNGEIEEPDGIAVADGIAYVADTGNNRVEEFSEEGTYLGQFGSEGSGNGQLKKPEGVAASSTGEVYVADTANSRVSKWGGSSSGLNLVHTTVYDPSTGEVTESRTPAAGAAKEETGNSYTFKVAFGNEGEESHKVHEPGGAAVAPSGDVYVADTKDSRVEEYSATGSYITSFGKEGTGNGEFEHPEGIAVAANGDVYVADTGNDRVQEFEESGTYLAQFGNSGSTEERVTKPSGVAVAPNGDVWVVNGSKTEELGSYRVREYTGQGKYVRRFGKEFEKAFDTCGDLAAEWVKTPHGIAVAPNGEVYLTDTGDGCVGEFNEEGKYIRRFGSEGTGNGQLREPDGVSIVDGRVYVMDTGNNRVQEFTESGEYRQQFGTEGSGNGQFSKAAGIGAAANGNDGLGTIYVADTANNRIDKWVPPAGESAHISQTIYYSASGDQAYPQCGYHPEWAELPCQSQPAAQPGTAGLPELPIVTDTYNMWDELETVTEKFGSRTRTKKMGYDTAGRLLTSEQTYIFNTSLPKVTNEYNTETGEMIEQSTTVGETTKSIQSVYDTLGQLIEYTDAEGSTTKYKYAGPENDNRVEEVSYEISKEKVSQTYSYDPTTKDLTKLVDSGPGSNGAGTFTATYDVEGNMTSETYPNAMTAKYARNSTGEATGLEYEKTAHCKGTCPEVWFKEAVTPSIHGEALLRTSTLAKEEYTYDNAGRLTQVNETPAGKGCKTRIYTYNEDSDRTSLTKRESGSETCATTGGTTEDHTYDSADRLTDTGTEYDTLGNMTKVPAGDAEGNAITAKFYVDNQTYEQTQNGETLKYLLDPEGRTRETISSGTTNSTVVDHYPAPGAAISWTSEGEKWTRNIPGIDGSLTATQTSGEAAVLQLQDLQGDIIARAALSETETKLLSTYNSTEFGVPTTTTPPKYSWLGATGLATELPSGATASGGSGYVPQLGAPLQTQPIVPPADLPSPTGPYLSTVSSQSIAEATAYGAGAPAREAERQKAKAEYLESLNPPVPPGATPTPEEGGADPCESTFLSERQYYHPIESLAFSAWVDVEWCYGGGKVLSSHVKDRGHHQGNTVMDPGYEMVFERWESKSEWDGNDWRIQQVALFDYRPPSWVEDSLSLPEYRRFVDFEFILEPDGQAKTSVEVHEESVP